METVGRLAGGIAHDFNNLLTAIIGYSELLLDRIVDQPDVTADIEEIRNAGQRASLLTSQLLAFSRKQAILPRVLDLNQVVGDLQKMLSRIIAEDIVLEITAAPSLGRTKVDPGQVEQVDGLEFLRQLRAIHELPQAISVSRSEGDISISLRRGTFLFRVDRRIGFS